MATTVNHPTLGTIEFPSEMGDADIVAAIKKLETQVPAAAPTVRSSDSPAIIPFSMMGQEPSFVPQNTEEARQFSSGFKQQTEQIAPQVVRYGPPVAAALATAPFTGGTSSLPAYLATQAAIQGAIGIGSEAAASAIEDSPMTLEKLGAAGMRGVGSGLFLPGSVGGFFPRVAGNIATGTAAELGARKIEGQTLSGLSGGDWALITGLPVAATALSGVGRFSVEREAARKSLAAERGAGTSVTVGDVIPAMIGAESRMYGLNVRLAKQLVDDIDTPISAKIAALESDPNLGIRFTQEFRPKQEAIANLQKLQDDAKIAADKAAQARVAYEANLESRNVQMLDSLKKQADEAALTSLATKALYSNQTKKMMFEAGVPLVEDVSVGAMQKAMSETMDAINGVNKRVLDDAYSTIGIKQNDQVGSLPMLLKSLDRAIPEQVARGRAKRLIENAYIELYSPTKFKKGEITREGLSDLKQKIAEGLVKEGKPVRAANREAAEIYSSVSKHAQNFISKTYGKEVAKGFADVNSKVAPLYKSIDSDLINYFRSGSDNPQAFVNQVILEGKGERLRELGDFLTSIRKFGDQYAPLAADLEQKVHSVVRQGLIEKNLNPNLAGGDTFKKIDVLSLASTLNKLSSQGYPIEMLKLGNPKDLAKLANLSTVTQATRMTPSELKIYSSLVPSLAPNEAFARIAYRRELKEQLIKNGYVDTSSKNVRLQRVAQELGIKSRSAERAVADVLDSIKDDPIIKLLRNEDNSISRLNLRSADTDTFINSLMDLPPSTVATVADTLKASGRTELLQDLKKAATAKVFKGMLVTPDAPGLAAGFSDAKFGDFFGKAGDADRLNKFKALLGDDYKTLEKGLLSQMSGIARTRAALQTRAPSDLNVIVRGAALPASIGQGRSATGNQILATAINYFLNASSYLGYHTAYLLYASPATAPLFAKAGYSLDNLSRLAPAEANKLTIAYELARKRDEQDKQSAQ